MGGEPGSGSALALLGEGTQGEQCIMWVSGDFYEDVGPGQTTLECNISSPLSQEEEAETIWCQKLSMAVMKPYVQLTVS